MTQWSVDTDKALWEIEDEERHQVEAEQAELVEYWKRPSSPIVMRLHIDELAALVESLTHRVQALEEALDTSRERA